VTCTTFPLIGPRRFTHADSNVYHWLDYLGPPGYVRSFIHTFIESKDPANNTADWRTFASNSWDDARSSQYGNQFGVSFAGVPVDSMDAYRAAVEDLRGRAREKGATPATTWIARAHPAVDWNSLFWPLSTEAIGVTLKQTGVPEEFLPRLQARGVKVMGIFDLDCHELAFETTDPNDPNYFKERWEQYRLMYLAGLWLAEQGVVDIELYNEPDKDTVCLDLSRWIDTAQINSQAFRESAADLGRPRPTLIAPSTAASFSTDFGESIFGYMSRPFGSTTDDPGFALFDSYAWHGYGDGTKCIRDGGVNSDCMPNGHSLRTKQDRVVSNVRTAGYGSMPTHISEFNCFTFKAAEELEGHVFDTAETAACVGAMIGGLMVRENIPTSLSLHKLVQNRVPSTDSGVGKNGVLFAQTTETPFDIGGSTKAFEVYRLILNRASAGDSKEIVEIPSPTHTFDHVSDQTIAWGLRHTGGRVLSIFMSHQGREDSVAIDMKSLGVPRGATVSVNRVDHSSHGDILESWTYDEVVNATYNVGLWTPQFLEAVVPLVPSKTVNITASEACAVDPSRRFSDDSGDFGITMDPTGYDFASNQPPRAILLKFDRSSLPAADSSLRVILRLFVRDGGGSGGEYATVIGFKPGDDVDWSKMSWDSAGIFKNYAMSSSPTIKDNIIDWGSDVTIVGYLRIPDSEAISDIGGRFVALDVTKAVLKRGITSFALVRNIRYDAGGGVKRDLPLGLSVFAGRQADDYVYGIPENRRTPTRPQLLVTVATNDPVVPYPSAPPPPPPSNFPSNCKIEGYFTLQGTPSSCARKGLLITHSLSSKKPGIFIKTKFQAKGFRRLWKTIIRRPGVYKGGFVTTIYAPGRRSTTAYLASPRSKVRLGTKSQSLMRIVPVSNQCERVTLISESRMAAGKPAYLQIDSTCTKLSWGWKRRKTGYQNFWLRPRWP
jgi:hypothetical protein